MLLPNIQSEVIINQKSTVSWISQEIIYVYYEPNSVLEVADFQESLDAFNKMSRGRSLKVLSEFGPYCSATVEARKFGENIELNATHEAMVFKGLAQRLLLRFFNALRKQKHPLRFFQSKEEALKWLESFE